MLDADERRARERQATQTGENGVRQDRGISGGMVANRPIQGSVNTAQTAGTAGAGVEGQPLVLVDAPAPPRRRQRRDLDPTIQCEQYRLSNPLGYEACVIQAQTSGSITNPYETTTRGGSFFRAPPQSSVQGSMSFHVTDNWAAQWQTSYDIER